MLKRKPILSMVLSIFLSLQNFPIFTAFAQSAPTNSITSRILGADRYATSLAISQNGWAYASNVIIATGLNFPDALSASALSKLNDAPIILTRPDSLSQDAINELKRLRTTNAFLIGGTGVINTSVEDQLKGLGISIIRLGGANRYDTSRKIAEQIGVNKGIAIATGENFPDALSIAPIASIKSIPILLSSKDGLDTSMVNFLKGKKIPASYIVGGTGVLDSSLEQSFPDSKRLSGSDRYATNLKINSEFASDLNFDTIYLATGNNFPDALSGSALAAKNNAPIILTDKNSISTDILNFLKNKNVKHVVILGGTGVISQEVEDQINAALIVKASSISLSKTSAALKIGDTDTLTAAVYPSNATNPAVKWSSSDVSVATVDSSGKVTAISEGTVIITATTLDGGFTASCTITVSPIKVTSISLNKTSATLLIGDTDTLTATVYPLNATNPAVNWSSSDASVATVDSNGKVTAISEGTVIITATTLDGSFTASCTFTVSPIKVTSVSLNKTSATLLIGDTDALNAIVYPSNATNPAVKWSSSDASLATVDSNGKVSAISEGTAIITATTLDGSFKASCTITVSPIKVTSVSLNKTSSTLIVGDTDTITATVYPSNATNPAVKWSSSDTSVATVDSNGKVTAISEGTVIITATTLNGGFTATLTLTVESLKIVSVNDINVKVYEWDNYSLPDTVLVNMNNGRQESRTVVWDSTSVDTSVIGIKTYQGTVEGYEGKVNLYLNVNSIQSDLMLTGRSYTLIGSYIYSYGITLTSYIPRNVNISKIEVYDNGRLNSVFTKDDLTSNNIPTVINPYSKWGISFSFRIGVSSSNSYIIVYIDNNGHDIPCKYFMTTY